MSDPTPLSPAAQKVLNAAVDAYGINYSEFYCCADRVAAAALRAAAEGAMLKLGHWNGPMSNDYDCGWNDGLRSLLAIATELEGNG